MIPAYSNIGGGRLIDWIGMIHMGGVNLNPDYQRDVVWGDQKMIMLIQSLFLVNPLFKYLVQPNEELITY